MKLQEVFDQLTSGELSQVSIGGEGAGVINEANWSTVVNHLNLGLTTLYKRFALKKARLKVLIKPDVTNYILKSSYAVANKESFVAQSARYLLDSASAPFKDDILKVERVLTDAGLDLSLNKEGDEYSVITPTSTSLQVPASVVTQEADLPDWLKTVNLELVYRANHPKLVVDSDFDIEEAEIELPDSHLEPLLYFVASRVNNPIGMGQEFNAGNNWFARYQAACEELENKNLQVDQDSDNCRLRSKGWV
jgi:hypothetical protein